MSEPERQASYAPPPLAWRSGSDSQPTSPIRPPACYDASAKLVTALACSDSSTSEPLYSADRRECCPARTFSLPCGCAQWILPTPLPKRDSDTHGGATRAAECLRAVCSGSRQTSVAVALRRSRKSGDFRYKLRAFP